MIPDHPAVARLLRFGLPEPPDPRCPYCGRAAERFFFHGSVCLGCEECVTVRDWWEAGIGEA